jgi:ArsR family transcriptional regulator
MHRINQSERRFKAKIFNALSDPTRLEILEFLRDREKCVCEIIPHLGLVQPLVSRHLRIMREAGLVKDRKEGNRRLYSVTDTRIFGVTDALVPKLVETLSKRVIEQVV